MFVQKFEADTLDEALKNIKRELGPDAIILKTITNKGLKGAFKKKRIEVTAAISEDNYISKQKVDTVLTNDQRDVFYSDQASVIKKQIDNHSKSERTATYGGMGLNKQVKTVKEIGNKIKSSLDDFLKSEEEINRESHFEEQIAPTYNENRQQKIYNENNRVGYDNFVNHRSSETAQTVSQDIVSEQRKKIDDLEQKVYELAQVIQRLDQKEPLGIYELRTTLRSLDISEHSVHRIVKKALFELNEEEVRDSEIVFEFALKTMVESIKTEMPLFSNLENSGKPAITVCLSEISCGQTSMIQKIAALKKDVVVIKSTESKKINRFAESIFNIDIVETTGIAEIVSECRKAREKGLTVFVDYKIGNDELNGEGLPSQTKKFIEGLKRAFDNVEVLITLSAVHSELYNRKVVAKYNSFGDGLVVSHLDECLNFGSLFNIGEDNPDQPFKFFGTGSTVPDDLESATAERILAGIFQLK